VFILIAEGKFLVFRGLRKGISPCFIGFLVSGSGGSPLIVRMILLPLITVIDD
jgi:hypothetical protein